jgi:Double zinc ribbon
MEQNYVVPSIYQDMSDQNQGYFAFRFTCRQCYWQIDTKPVRSTISTVSNIADIGIGFLGGFLGRAAEAGQKIYGSQWHQEQAGALQKAWAEVQHLFHFCPKCQETVCNRCFNSQLGLCLRDAPDLRADGAHVKHEQNLDAQRKQIEQGYEAPRFDINAIPSAVSPEMLRAPQQQAQISQRNQPMPMQAGAIQTVTCPQCHQMGAAGKFCQECGARLPQPNCPGCGAPRTSPGHFCQECGCKLA